MTNYKQSAQLSIDWLAILPSHDLYNNYVSLESESHDQQNTLMCIILIQVHAGYSLVHTSWFIVLLYNKVCMCVHNNNYSHICFIHVLSEDSNNSPSPDSCSWTSLHQLSLAFVLVHVPSDVAQ